MTSLAEARAPEEAEVDQDFAPGVVLAGRYEVLGVLGEGGMGKVYLAEHVEVGRKVAIKVLLAEWSAHPQIVRRFRAEARTAGAIGHPNIVQVFDAGALPDGRLFLAMEHLAGRDLADELAAVGTLDPRRACALLRQVALALGAGHRAGIVHRDIKPSNVMLVPQPDGEVAKVLDFGIAANGTIGGIGGERLTDPGSLMGTPEYMAPEQASGAEPGPSFDVYALGVMLYEALTGTLPVTATHAFELLALKLNRPAPSLALRRPDLPASLVQLVDDCLRIAPAARPADGDAVAARIEAVLADMRRNSSPVGHAISPTVLVPTGAQSVVPPRRIPALALALAGVAVAAGLAFALVPAREGAPVEVAEAAPMPAAGPIAAQEPVAESPVADEPAVAPAADPPPTAALTDAPDAARAEPDPKDMPVKTAVPAAVRPTARPAPQSSDEHLTARCQRVRATAEEARRAQRWAMLRDQSRQRECWASAAEARKLQTKALMELGDFAGCLSVGKGSKDQEVQAWLKLCQKRLGG